MDIPVGMIGKAGELRVRSELLQRGIGCGSFDFDDGTDVITNRGIKIGVKASLRPIHSKGDYSWRYTFSIRQPQVRNAGKGIYERKYTKRDYVGYVDYWIFWCIKDNIFYIIPNGEVGQKVSFCISTPEFQRKYIRHTKYESISRYEKYKDNWEQLR